MSKIKLKGLNNLNKTYRNIEKNVPTLKRNTLNDMARYSQKLAKLNFANKFEQRNTFSIRSIWIRKATKSPNSFSAVGSVQQYMADQEFGDANHKISSIPSNEARIQRNPKRVVSRPRRLRNLGTAKFKARGKRNVFIAIKQAQRAGEKGPFKFEMKDKKGNRAGLYILRGGRRNTRLRLIHDISKPTVNLRSRPWLTPAIPPTIKQGEIFFKRNLNHFIKKI
jgi:hypothetical protein